MTVKYGLAPVPLFLLYHICKYCAIKGYIGLTFLTISAIIYARGIGFFMLEKQIIGRNCLVSFKDDAQAVPAKVDTGADASAVWASDIYVDSDNFLHFKLFAPESEFYSGKEYIVSEYSVSNVTNASGTSTIKFKAKLSAVIDGRSVRAYFGLSDRSGMRYPILIGRHTLKSRFIVDVEDSSSGIPDYEPLHRFQDRNIHALRRFFRYRYRKV